MSCIIINDILGIEDKSYLELGIAKGKNFNAIKCKDKFSVDINRRAMFIGTSDSYFDELDEDKKFDIIFIDANHDYDFVVRDFNNAQKHCNEWILIHDMIPPTLKHTKSALCSDSFRFLYCLLKETQLEIYPMNNNFGLTFIKMPAYEVIPDESYKTVSYKTVMNFLSTKKLYSDEEIINILNNKLG